MVHKLISTVGLGVLGIDPFTAVYLLSMGLRREKKSRVSLFFLSFAAFSVLIGAALAAVFGAAAVDILKRLMPGDESPFWAVLNFALSVFILVWVLRRLLAPPREQRQKEERASGGWWKQLTGGLLFALSSFTDPTYYAVILLGGESRSFLLAVALLAVWFAVSQWMALVVYGAIGLGLLEKLTAVIDRLKQRDWSRLTHALYGTLLLVSAALLADALCYLLTGSYLL